MNKLLLLIPAIIFTSCSFLLKNLAEEKYEVVNIKGKDKLKIIFSHNINGETHPCGCRQNPLGGLPQVAGALHEAKQSAEVLYVDTGDTFFPSAKFPKTVEKSLKHTAYTLAEAMTDLELKYFVPGDQDFATDMEFLNELNSKNDFTFLISNLSDQAQLQHKTFSIYQKGPHKVFFMGIVDPKVLSSAKYSSLFIDPLAGITRTFKEIEKAGYKKDDPFHRLILLSHAGLNADEQLARQFPHFDWIIGAHSQSFTRFPIKEGKTRPVQVLSRNHYLGEINIDLTKDKKADHFQILEMRDDQKNKLKPNPFITLIDSHKEMLKVIQKNEQSELLSQEGANSDHIPHATAASCIECHTEQGQFWQQTPHSLAYATLINANEEKNLKCIKCHSFGLGSPKGFQTQKNLIHIASEQYVDPSLDNFFDEQTQKEKKAKAHKKLNHLKKEYWQEVTQMFKEVKSVRQLSPSRRVKLATAWQNSDDKHKVTHNFANVQCLNCHDKHVDHPFTNYPPKGPEKKYANYKNKCLSCHVSDQSPQWYKEGGEVDELKLLEKIKSVSCPKYQE